MNVHFCWSLRDKAKETHWYAQISNSNHVHSDQFRVLKKLYIFSGLQTARAANGAALKSYPKNLVDLLYAF